MKKRCFIFLCGLVICLTGMLFGQTADQVFSDFDRLEERVFRFKSEGQYQKALEELFDCVLDLIRVRATSPQDISAELEARGECYLEMMYDLMVSTARFEDGLEVLDRVPEQASHLKALARYYKMHTLLHLGRIEDVRAIKKELGIIDDWYLIGPFDNERGGGFNTVFDPEKTIDLTAEYPGKERPVRWRKDPVSSLTGFIDLNALFNPDDQSLAYALAFIDAEEEKDIALHLGSDEAVKVFFNGQPAFALDARRLYHFQQDVVGLHLNKGVNVLMFKVCDQTGGWGFSARLTTPSGMPLTGVSAVEAPEGFSLPETPDSLPEVDVSTGAKGYFEERAASGNARAHLHLAILHFAREYEGEKAGIATKQFDAFLKANPDHEYGTFLRALTELRRTDIRAEKDPNKWRAGLEATLAINPENVEAHVHLGEYYLTMIRIPNQALEHAKAALEANRDFLPASYLLADVYEAEGMNALSRKVLIDLSHKPDNLRYPKLRLILGDLAQSERRKEDAAEQWKAALEIDHRSSTARSRLTNRALEAGAVDQARALLDERAALDPFDRYPLRMLARLALGDGNGEGAIPLLEKILAVNPEEDGTLKRLGDVFHQLGKEDEALAYYKKALEINPKLKNLRRYVEFLHEGERPFEDDFKVDVLALMASHPASDNPDNDSHEYLLLQNVYKANPDGTSSHYHHRIVRLLNLEGVKLFDYFVTFYTPGEQKCRILTARIIHPDGSVEDAKIDNTSRRASPEFGDRAPAFVDLPPLKPGDTVDVEYRTDDLKQSFFGDYFGLRQFFQPPDRKGVREARLTLILPLDRSFQFNQKNLELDPEVERNEKAGTEIRTWTLSDLSKIDRERFMPGRTETTPYVDVTSYDNWDAFGRWWWNLVKEQSDMTDEMRAKVKELTEGLTTELDRIRAIYNFVVSDIRYNDTWEFGVHGFKPYRASSIFTNRFGDCKDKAILLKTLLGEAGIEAFPVLIRLELPRSKEDLTLPLVSHFNHAIAFVPEVDGGEGIFLDGTAQYHPMDVLPGPDQGATVFVVKDGLGKIMTIPYQNKDVLNNRYDVTLLADGKAAIKAAHEARGRFDGETRRRFLNPGKRKSVFEKIFGSVLGEVTVKEFEFTDVEDLNIPVKYDVSIEAENFLLKSGDRVQLRPVFLKSGIFSLASEDERRFDLLLGAPYSINTTLVYKLPGGFSIPEPPPDTNLDNEFASFSLTFEIGEDRSLKVRRTLSIKTPRIGYKEYPTFRDFCREAERAEERLIQISLEG